MSTTARLLRDAERNKAEANMTPMIDVIFLLIIFFLCIDFRSLEAKLAAYLPKDVGIHTTEAEPIEKIDLRIFCEARGTEVRPYPGAPRFDLEGHKTYWQVGPRVIRDEATLREELARLARDKHLDPRTQTMKPSPVTVHAYENVTYGDVAAAIDLAKDVGFDEITFGGARGTERRN